MKILVTGGTGFLGKPLVEKLSKKHEVTVLDLKKIPGQKKTKYIIGSLLEKTAVEKAARGQDVVYHLAAVLDETAPNLYRVNVAGTKLLLEACVKNRVKRIIFVSPIGLLGESKKPLKEDDPYNPRTRYERSKRDAEQIIKEYAKNKKIEYTIVRATIVYGPNRYWKQIFSAAKKHYPLIGNGANKWHLLYYKDALDALLLALKPQAKNQTYNLAGPEAQTYEKTYQIISKSLGTKPPKKHVPVWLAKLSALVHETKSKILRKRPNVTKIRASIDRLVQNREVDTAKIRKELGYKPKYGLEKGMLETVRELKKTGEI